jgi:hypothetical protein
VACRWWCASCSMRRGDHNKPTVTMHYLEHSEIDTSDFGHMATPVATICGSRRRRVTVPRRRRGGPRMHGARTLSELYDVSVGLRETPAPASKRRSAHGGVNPCTNAELRACGLLPDLPAAPARPARPEVDRAVWLGYATGASERPSLKVPITLARVMFLERHDIDHPSSPAPARPADPGRSVPRYGDRPSPCHCRSDSRSRPAT